ncbi:NAD(P)H-binding protein [Bradyrhizobium manausense]|uniref:SDR family oxidoreductase n=1 Tax=Bradyrhizobium manausense TaxID=989370 RepID=UPI001BA991D1|nr:NAD(P)H-binding protein [Bradyrhizobium manausense]MBR0725491.1 NAD(P)H-binding protein [Bradyrhizobium manausense]MBR0834175.1 NAD(P)H-binding protein [Bradyrhizobium manausense]
MTEKILVTGATGNTGRYLVEMLLAKGECVKATSRGEAAVANTEAVRFDMTDASTYASAFQGLDRAFMVIPAGYLDNIEGSF